MTGKRGQYIRYDIYLLITTVVYFSSDSLATSGDKNRFWDLAAERDHENTAYFLILTFMTLYLTCTTLWAYLLLRLSVGLEPAEIR
jgi:hypothetical protein